MDWPSIEAIVYGDDNTPDKVLGRHSANGYTLYQAFLPDAEKVELKISGSRKVRVMEKVDEEGFFAEGILGKELKDYTYKVTNKENNKIYIGQTIQNPKQRWRHHLEEAKLGSDLKFHKALRKYGKDLFSWEVLEIVNENELNEREKYWISYFDSYKNGYNSTEGGDNPPRNDVSVICLETLQIFKSCVSAGESLNISSVHIAECAKGECGRVTAGGYHWMKLSEYEEKGPIFRKTGNELSSKKILCIETNTAYNSILEASKDTGLSRSTIKRICDSKVKNPQKFHWSYIEDK